MLRLPIITAMKNSERNNRQIMIAMHHCVAVQSKSKLVSQEENRWPSFPLRARNDALLRRLSLIDLTKL